jgi:plastocyanin
MGSDKARIALSAVALVTLLSGCGGADEGAVRQIGTESGSGGGSGSASGSGSVSGSASGSGSGSGSAVAAAEQDCAPVGEDLESQATGTVDLKLTDYAFEPDEVTVEAGVTAFATRNVGDQPHELAFLPGGGEVPFTEDGAPDEEALEGAGAFELEAYGPDQDCNATYELDAGTYTLFCIVEAPDGQTHYEKGMRGTLEVR